MYALNFPNPPKNFQNQLFLSVRQICKLWKGNDAHNGKWIELEGIVMNQCKAPYLF